MPLSPEELIIIQQNPLEPCLKKCRSALQALADLEDLEIEVFPIPDAMVDRFEKSSAMKVTVIKILEKLQGWPAANQLRSRRSAASLAHDLEALHRTLSPGTFELKPFVPLLEAIWSQKSDHDIWHEVVNIIDAWPASENSTPQTLLGVQISSVDVAALQTAWTSEYRNRKTIDLLRCGINTRFIDPKRYSNSFAVIQSSGMGKSRLIDELAKECLTFPFCLRMPDEKGIISHPPADDCVRDFILRPTLSKTVSLRLKSCCFFTALFHLASRKLCDIHCSGDLPRNWYTFLANKENRNMFYQDVIDNATVYLHVATAQLNKDIESQKRTSSLTGEVFSQNNAHLESAMAAICGKLEQLIMHKLDTLLQTKRHLESSPSRLKVPQSLSPQEDLNSDVYVRVQQELHAVSPTIRSRGNAKVVEILVTFDEAHTLKDLAPVTSLFHTLRHSPIYMIYMSTTSSSDILAPTVDVTNSARLKVGELRLNPAFTELPLRVFVDDIWTNLLKPPYYLESFCLLASAAALGRPLWGIMVQNGLSSDLFDTVYMKLCPGKGHSEENLEAALTCRLLLRTQNSQAGLRLASRIVASHLATAFHIPRHRQYIVTGYPPEPLVAAAATRFMLQLDSTTHIDSRQNLRRSNIIDALINMHDLNMINRGNFGELVGRLYYMLARDGAFLADNQHYNELPKEKVPYLEPVSLITFFQCLIGNEHSQEFNKILNSQYGSEGATFQNLFAHAVVHFVSWAQACESKSLLTFEGALLALSQAYAIQCLPGQKSFDLVIHVVMDPSRALTHDNLAVLVVQIKNRHDHHTEVISNRKYPRDMPVIFILHELDSAGKPFKVKIHEDRMPRRSLRSTIKGPLASPLFKITIVGINSQLIDHRQCEHLLQSWDLEPMCKETWLVSAPLGNKPAPRGVSPEMMKISTEMIKTIIQVNTHEQLWFGHNPAASRHLHFESGINKDAGGQDGDSEEDKMDVSVSSEDEMK